MHVPVLCDELLDLLSPARDGLIVDATVGTGGHASALLESYPSAWLIGSDRDPEALQVARSRLSRFGWRAAVVRCRISLLPRILATRPSAFLADLGVSMLQLERPWRGFSFLRNGPLDMRMEKRGPSAADLVNSLTEAELARIIWEYGEEPMARRIARAIVAARDRGPITTTSRLAAVVSSVSKGKRGLHPATKTFQALRIAVNAELEEIRSFIPAAAELLKPGGMMAIISFHSLEDRIVKLAFRNLSGRCVCPPGSRTCTCNPRKLLEVVTKKPIRPSEAEVKSNPRSRSARLRVARRFEDG